MRTLGYVFGAVGVVLVAACLFAIAHVIAFQRHALHATGTIVAIKPSQSYSRSSNDSLGGRYITVYAPVVEFESPTGKQRFVGGVRSSAQRYHVGQNVDILYPANAPADAQIDAVLERWLSVIVLGPLALAFGGIGAGFGLYFWRRRRLARWLAQFGVRVKAAYLGAEPDTSLSSGGKNPWRLVCEWQDAQTGKSYRMRSDPMWEDPRAQVGGDTLDVIIDPADPRRYQIVVDFLGP